VVTGSLWVVESEDPKDWAKKIRDVREKSREVRLEEAKLLREMYLKKFRWQESCDFLLQKMEDLVFGKLIKLISY
jgi:glycosyltransferase involved in cell wall biosynthesis